MKKISFILLTCLMLIFGVTISIDRLNTIDSVNAASQTIANMFTPYNLRFTNNWLYYTADFYFNSNGTRFWTDGTNIYYSYNNNNYILDIATSTWSAKTWNGISSFNGSNVWTDGTNIYYSSASDQYILDIATSTWSAKTWNGLSSFNGNYIWTDGTNIYFSSASDQYILDISTSTWSAKIWNGISSFSGERVFVLNDIVLLNSSGYSWYMLEKDTSGGGDGGGNDTDTYFHFTGSSYIMYGFSKDLTNSYAYVDIWNSYFDIQDTENNETVITLTNYGFKYRATSTAGDLDILNIVPVGNPSIYYTDTLTIYRETSYTNENSDNFVNGYQAFRATTTGWTNSDIVGCTLSSELNIDANNNNFYYLIYNFHYFNSLNERLLLQIVTRTPRSLLDSANVLPDNWILWSERTIYFSANTGTDGSYQDGYNTGYADGQEIGYTNGFNAGSASSYNTGYNEGLQVGNTNGYNRGYSVGFSDGVASSNDYSFFGLISAVVDAPINAFTSLFNFNILGVNILDLLTGLITLIFILVIVKFILGGR